MDQTQLRGWWGRNWKWVLPVGCLGSLVIPILLCAGILGAIMGGMKTSWACTEGLELARNNPAVIAQLGEPIEPGWMISGSIHVSGSSGKADLAIPLNGSKNSGTLYVVAHKDVGQWLFDQAEVEVNGQQERINLLPEKPRDKPGADMKRDMI